MTKGLGRSLNRGPALQQNITKQTFVLDALALVIDGAAGVGFGSVVLGGLPEGNLLFLGATSYLAISGPGSDAGLVDTFEGDYGVGTIPMSDATLGGGDVDIIQSTAMAAAVAEVGPRTRGTSLAADTGEIHDNTDGSLELNLNVLVDDAHISADGIAFTATGELQLVFVMLGDD